MNTYHRPPREPDIKAIISFFSTTESGRSTPALSGYRPSHNMGIDGMLNDGQHEYIDNGSLSPGESTETYIWFLCPEYQEGRLYPSMTFTVQEGNRILGKGIIIEVINKKLSKN